MPNNQRPGRLRARLAADDTPQPNFNTVLADKKIGGHLPNCQRAIQLSINAEPSILALSMS